MRNHAAVIFPVALLVGAGLGFSSCKDDEPPVPPKLSFAESTMTVNEDAGVIEVELVLDKPYSRDLNVEYTLGGTASDQDAVGTANADYEVVGTHGVVVIESGATSGIIALEIYSDDLYEEDETIEISIIDVNTSDVQLTADDEIVITIVNDDAQAVASFASTSMTVNEDEGTGFYFALAENYLLIPVHLDNPASRDITIEYSLEGTALDSVFAANFEPQPIPQQYYDFYINGNSGELVIPAGETSANIEIGILSDFVFEDNETIEITLTGSNAATIGTGNTMTITIVQQDGKSIVLDWMDPEYTDVDMDLFLWVGQDVDNLTGILASSAFGDVTEKREVIFIPSVITDGAFGLSHNYYSGTANPLNFKVRFVDYTDGQLEAEANEDVFTATYTADNLNPYLETNMNPIIVQTFKIVAGAYVDITNITVPTSGSRIKTVPELPKEIMRSLGSPPRTL